MAIYRIANGVMERMTVPSSRNPIGFHANTQGNPQVSADGSVFSYTAYVTCNGGGSCISYPSNSTSFLTGAGGTSALTLSGEADISRNGRFVLNYLTTCCPLQPTPDVIQIHDFQTSTNFRLPLPPSERRQAVTSSGTALLLNSQTGSVAIWSPQSARALSTAETPKSAILDNLGTWIVYEAFAGSQADLRGFEIATGHDVLLASRPLQYWYSPAFDSSISNDATTVLYLAAPQSGQPSQVWTIHPDGTGRRQLTTFSQDVSEAVLSGNGQTAILATGGQIVSIDIATGAVRELIATTPTCYHATPLVPGSLAVLPGTGLVPSTQAASAPLPTEPAGIQVLINGTPLPLLSVSSTEIWFQIPFEASPGTIVRSTVDYGSPFGGCSIADPISAREPVFVSDSSGNTIFVHQDFGGLVTPQMPAQRGEVVIGYALGLGGVAGTVATGVPTPSDQLFPLISPFSCYLSIAVGTGVGRSGDTGLAPGMIGIYQVNIRLPDPLPYDNYTYYDFLNHDYLLSFNCGTPANLYERGGGSIPIAAPGQE